MRRRRVSPAWWPVLAVTAPLWGPWAALRCRGFRRASERAEQRNAERLRAARPIGLPEVERLEVTAVVDELAVPGFDGEEGVSYLLRTELGALLIDVGFGPATPVFARNASRLGLSWDRVDALAVTHLHGDHVGGLPAARARRVALPQTLLPGRAGLPCFLPEPGDAPGFAPVEVEGPRLLAAGIGSTGPLSRSLFFLGPVEEQALLVRVRGKGLVIVTGCGHPGVELIVEVARRLAPGPVHAIVGGLHYPLTSGRGDYPGFEAQMLFGTGRPPWRRITDDDLSRAVSILNEADIERAILSAHDSCDHALRRFADELDAKVEVVRAGESFLF